MIRVFLASAAAMANAAIAAIMNANVICFIVGSCFVTDLCIRADGDIYSMNRGYVSGCFRREKNNE